MSSVENLGILKKILGRLPRSEFSEHDTPLDLLIDFLSAPEHLFIPETAVDDTGTTIPVNAFLVYIVAKDAPCYINLDRDITEEEYSIVFPSIGKTIARRIGTLYAKAPEGQVSKIRVEALKRA